MTLVPEFSRPVPLARLGAKPLRQQIAATIGERAALARRFGLISLDRLEASVELVRKTDQLVLLDAQFEAAFEQSCSVSLDPIAGAVAAQFQLLYGPPEAEEAAAELVADEVAFEPLTGDVVDLGEAVAQEFSLSLPPFPRSPDAIVESKAPVSDEQGPFAALTRLFERNGGAR